ncbi:MAG: transcriptional regulator, PadR family [Nocardioides sp.]|nr:transcriptional regulator, PadR family [Nocardioides sp.]
MGHQGFNRQWARHLEEQWNQHRSGPGPWGAWGGGPGRGRPGHQGPPPWVSGLFGLAQGEQRRGPRVRRGDVRAAILDVLRTSAETGEPVNGYQVIQQIAERSNGAWRPSPGSVYPTIQQLEDEGLVETDADRGRRSLRLTTAGQEYVGANPAELAAVWTPFEEPDREEQGAGFGDLKPEIGQVMGAVWQIVTTGSPQQRRAAVDILVETRRKLYGVLADGDEAEPDTDDDGADAAETGEGDEA